ncbi:MAG: hypothetical protein A2163_11395 [Actinobacteria bacterium RBG_13_35_12]|jgi:hypothetical protein|nr:MAG: hypothetical protein A2163_11395 [Actinobacteria bacterium RBG_13_35_12]
MPGGKKDKSPVESFGDMVKEFGEVISKIFGDPELKKKAKDFAKSAEDSAKAFGSRFKDEGVKEKFKDFGKAARNFGESVSDYYKDDKEKDEDISQKEYEWEKKLDEKMKNFGERAEKAGKEIGKKVEEAGDKIHGYFKDTRSGRITGYSFAIIWSVILFVFFNFYNQYIAYYHYDGVWHRYPLLTESFSQWLPIVSAALIASIVGNILLIIYDSYFFRHIIHIALNLFRLAAVVSLLTIFPFDFTVFPRDLTGILNPIVILVLVLIIIGIGVETIVRLIKLIVNAAKVS